MNLQSLEGTVRRAVDDYHMIDEGDKIAVGLSGGKDGLALLLALSRLRTYYPKKFDLEAVTVDLGFPDFDLQPVIEFCKKLQVPYTVVPTDIGKIVFDLRKEKNPCSLCSQLRKGALNRSMKEKGCRKIAYAHHKDDVVDTFMMSLLYEGSFHMFQPVTDLNRSGLTLIRPLIYVSEQDIITIRDTLHLPAQKSPCPADKHTRRESMKKMIQIMEEENPGVRKRIFTAIKKSGLTGW